MQEEHLIPPIHLRVYLSSPGDVANERALARQVLQMLSYDPAFRGRVTLEVISWDDPAALTPVLSNLTPQEAANRGLIKPSECDLVVMILWSRMGTPLPSEYRKSDGEPYLSGVEWEYEDAYSASPQPDILIYHRAEVPMVSLKDPLIGEKIKQLSLLEKFLARFRSSDGSMVGAINLYENPSRFASKFEMDMRSLVVHRIASVEEARRSSLARRITIQTESKIRADVFVSYCHADEGWLERIQVHLKPLVKDFSIKYWDDTMIKPGSDWRKEIETALSTVRVAILLISADFLASEFITTEELPRVLGAAEEEGAIILPLIVSPSRFSKTVSLSRFQTVNPPSKPLIGMTRAESEAIFAKVADAVEDALRA